MGTAQPATEALRRAHDPLAIKVLVLEDRIFDAELIVAELRRAGFDPEWSRAEDAAGYLRLLGAGPDVILADYSLPQFGALEALELLNARGADIPFIVVSGAMSEEEAVECMRRGAADYLIKDRLGRLGFAVRRALADRDARAQRRLAEHQRLQLQLEQAARAREQERSARLRGLAEVSVAITSSLSVDEVLHEVTERARALVGAHQAITSLTRGRGSTQAITAASFSDKYAEWRGYDVQPIDDGIYRLVCEENRSYRLSQDELEAHPTRRGFGAQGDRRPPLRGWLAAPLVGYTGGNLGLIQLSDKADGSEFDEDDEAVLVQLARLASVAIENATLYQQAREAVRARDEFLSIASHELRNPIAGIKGTAQLCRRFHGQGRLDDERIGRYLETIESTADRLAGLTEDLLDVARLQTGQLRLRPRPTDLAALVGAALERQFVHVEEHAYELIATGEPMGLIVDPDRIDQIITNLFDNAIKYSPDGGTVRVTLQRDADGVLLHVQDAGIGLPADAAARIFEPFGRAGNAAARNIPGLGLGLYICRRIAEQHGGRLWAESEGEGRGTTFSLWLPDHPVPERRSDTKEAADG